MYCGVPGPFCSFVLLLRGWPGDLHAGSCYGPGYCSAPEPGSQHDPVQYEMLNMKPPSWGIPALPAAVMSLEHQCMPPCYSSNNQMKAVADIHRYRYKYMWRFGWNIVNNSIAILGIQRVSCVQGRWLSELFHSCFCWIFHLSQGLCHATSIFQRIGHHYILPQRNSQRREDKG